mgnify:CR=1 FL=1
MWWFLLKSILSAVLGSQFYKWYQSTTVGIWFQSNIDQFMEYVSNKYNIELIKKQSKFEADYPLMMNRIEELERKINEKTDETIRIFFKRSNTREEI